VSKRTIRYIVVAVLLIVGLVLAYFALQEPKRTQAAGSEPKPELVPRAAGEDHLPGRTQF
jgi:hypothetical protein